MAQSMRVLVAEDELIIATDLCQTITEAGYVVEGPYGNLSSAMRAYREHKPDVAILDVRLGDGSVYPLAEELLAEQIPVIFHSCELTPAEVARRFPQAQAMPKPCPPAEVIATVQQALHQA